MMEHILYFDNSSKPLKEKIAKLVIKFRKKRGEYPTECLALPSTIGELKKVGFVQVKPKPDALQDHFWLGANDEPVSSSPAS